MTKTYTQEQVDIEILKTKSDSMVKTLDSVRGDLENLNSSLKMQFNNFTNYILGIYGILLASALAHLSGIF